MKIEAKNILTRKLEGSKWGITPITVQITELAICFIHWRVRLPNMELIKTYQRHWQDTKGY